MFIAFRLKPGRDADLISWLEEIESGDRSYFIRQVMRQGLQKNSKMETTCPEIRINPKEINEESSLTSEADLEKALNEWM